MAVAPLSIAGGWEKPLGCLRQAWVAYQMSLVCIRLGVGVVSASFRRPGLAAKPVAGRRPEVYTGPRRPGGSSDVGRNLHELVGEASFVADETSLWSPVRVVPGLLSVGTPEFDKSTRETILYHDYG